MGFHAKGMDGRIDDPKAELERQRTVVRLRRSSDPSHRRRQRHEAQSGEVPTSPRPAGEVKIIQQRCHWEFGVRGVNK